MNSVAFTAPSPLLPRKTTTLRKQVPVAILEHPQARPTTSPVWTPSSWRHRPALQQPTYPDPNHLRSVERQLSYLPPIVAPGELASLKKQLANVCNGHGFVLQGGDCAEDLNDSASDVKDTLRALFKMAIILMWGSKEPVIKIGRLAGQYGKPRSSDTEVRDGVELPSYRGEVRSHTFCQLS